MERTSAEAAASAAGFVVMLAGFAGYVASPETAWLALFAVGLIVMVVPYVMLNFENKRSGRRMKEIEDDETVNGYLYYMDGDPSPTDASIADLRRSASTAGAPYANLRDPDERSPPPDVGGEEARVCYMHGEPSPMDAEIVDLRTCASATGGAPPGNAPGLEEGPAGEAGADAPEDATEDPGNTKEDE